MCQLFLSTGVPFRKHENGPKIFAKQTNENVRNPCLSVSENFENFEQQRPSKTSKHKKPFISAPGLAIAILSVFSDQLAHIQVWLCKSPSFRTSYTRRPSRPSYTESDFQNFWNSDWNFQKFQSFTTGVSNFDYFWKVFLVSILGNIFGKFCESFGRSKPLFYFGSLSAVKNFWLSTIGNSQKSKISGKRMGLLKTQRKDTTKMMDNWYCIMLIIAFSLNCTGNRFIQDFDPMLLTACNLLNDKIAKGKGKNRNWKKIKRQVSK